MPNADGPIQLSLLRKELNTDTSTSLNVLPKGKVDHNATTEQNIHLNLNNSTLASHMIVKHPKTKQFTTKQSEVKQTTKMTTSEPSTSKKPNPLPPMPKTVPPNSNTGTMMPIEKLKELNKAGLVDLLSMPYHSKSDSEMPKNSESTNSPPISETAPSHSNPHSSMLLDEKHIDSGDLPSKSVNVPPHFNSDSSMSMDSKPADSGDLPPMSINLPSKSNSNSQMSMGSISATSKPNNLSGIGALLSSVPMLGDLAKDLKIKGCKCKMFICSCCLTTKMDIISGDGK